MQRDHKPTRPHPRQENIMRSAINLALEQHLQDWIALAKYSLFGCLVWGCWATPPVGWGLLAMWVFFFGGSMGKAMLYSFAPAWYLLKVCFFPLQLLLIATGVLDAEDPSDLVVKESEDSPSLVPQRSLATETAPLTPELLTLFMVATAPREGEDLQAAQLRQVRALNTRFHLGVPAAELLVAVDRMLGQDQITPETAEAMTDSLMDLTMAQAA
jgi:hypothetical protein